MTTPNLKADKSDLGAILVHFSKQLGVAQGIHQGGALAEAQLYAEKAQKKAETALIKIIEDRCRRARIDEVERFLNAPISHSGNPTELSRADYGENRLNTLKKESSDES